MSITANINQEIVELTETLPIARKYDILHIDNRKTEIGSGDNSFVNMPRSDIK